MRKHIHKQHNTNQIHEYNSNIIYTQYKQQIANTKNTPPPTHTYIDMIWLTMEMKQFSLCIQRHTNIQYKT